MKNLNTNHIDLMNILNDLQCHSGIELGLRLQVSRTAIWKYVQQLRLLGLPIRSIDKKGYQLDSPIYLLDEKAIRSQLERKQFQHPIHIELLTQIDSTNQRIKTHSIPNTLMICCAEEQTQGRGRFGRQWFSPFGENIYLSSKWLFPDDMTSLSGLSLIVGLAVISALQQCSIPDNIQIKWPNDLIWQHRKLGGILIEIQGESHGEIEVIIGIGLNVNTKPQSSIPINKPWCTLREMTKQCWNRNLIIAELIASLYDHIQRFKIHGLAAYQSEWQKVDYLKNQSVTVRYAQHVLKGKAQGINTLGNLVVLDEIGKTHHLSAGEASLNLIEE